MLTAILGFLGSSGALKAILDRIPNPEERRKAEQDFQMKVMENEQKFMEIMAKADSDQVEVNKAEAQSNSLFVSGWRPFIGWVCGSAFAYFYIVQPFLGFILTAAGHPIVLPKIEFGEMSSVLLGMLGLGGMRTWEKTKGVASK